MPVVPKQLKGRVATWAGTRSELKALIEEHINMLRAEMLDNVLPKEDDDEVPPKAEE